MNKDSVLKQISDVIKEYRLIEDRISALKKRGFNIGYHAMGSGGVGQVRETKKEYHVQIGYGRGLYNYVYCVVIQKSINNRNYQN